jgi:hypothetical protein
MCRSIRTLRPPFVEDVTDGDVEAAARQYVRKLTGFREPSVDNQEAFDTAIRDIAAATERLLQDLTVRGRPAVTVVPGPERKPPSRPRS